MLPRSHTAIVLVQPMCHLPTPALLRGCSSAGIPHNDKSVCHCHVLRHNTTASDVGSTPSSTRRSAAATALKHKRYVPNTVLHDAPLRTISLLCQPPWRQRVLCFFCQQRQSVPHAGQCFDLAAPLMMATHMVCESMHSCVARRRSAVVLKRAARSCRRRRSRAFECAHARSANSPRQTMRRMHARKKGNGVRPHFGELCMLLLLLGQRASHARDSGSLSWMGQGKRP